MHFRIKRYHWYQLESAKIVTPECEVFGEIRPIGVLLAAMGIYGVIAFLVAQRTPEIGVHMAMGATKLDILELMGMQGLRMITAGTLVGLLIAVVGSHALSSLLFGVRPNDPLSLASVCLLLAIVAGPATWIPACRAMKVEPSQALRMSNRALRFESKSTI
jgi:putative ABC transport system permease protein